jgi:hypothetical protein
MEFTVLLLLLVPWLLSHIVLMPRPIKGIPHNFFARYMPWGDILLLGLYYFYTGEVFSWLSLQNLQHKSAIVQLFLPSFSTTHPTLVIADLEEISKIVTRRLGEIDRADLMHTWFGVVISRATIGLKSSDKQFKEQRRLWNVVLSPKSWPMLLQNVSSTLLSSLLIYGLGKLHLLALRDRSTPKKISR